MLNRDFASVTARIAAANKPEFAIANTPDLGMDFALATKAYNDEQKKQALISAIKAGDEEAMTAAAADLNPTGTYDYLQKIKQARADADLAFERQKELARLNNSLDTERLLQVEQLKHKLKNIYGDPTAAQQNVAFLTGQGYSPEEAAMMVFGGQNPTLNLANLGKKGAEAYDKKIGEDLAAQDIAKRQMRVLEPRARAAIDRAKSSLQEGTGLGQFGGIGWTTGQGGINRANVKNAQAQINTTMRGLLKEMGVGSTEMNSALEAEAYRYNIEPSMPIEQQEQVLKNFDDDYLSGKLANELSAIYGKQQQTPIDPRVLEALKDGYTMEQINAYLGR